MALAWPKGLRKPKPRLSGQLEARPGTALMKPHRRTLESTPKCLIQKHSNFAIFYPNRFGQFLSEIQAMPLPNPIFIKISD
jgi:hypothetical protein